MRVASKQQRCLATVRWIGLAVVFISAICHGQSVNTRLLETPDFVGELYESSTGNRPLLLLGGSEGGIPWHGHREPIRELSRRGFTVLALPYFRYQELPSNLIGIPLEYFDSAIAWLKEESKRDCVGIVGGSKGAEAALLVAARNDPVCVVGAMSPSAYVFQGIRLSSGPSDTPRSSWSVEGSELPFAAFVDNENRRRAISNRQELRFIDVYRDAVRDPLVRKRARIPVERINGPVVLLSGRNDVLWPSTEMGSVIIDALRAHPFQAEHFVFDTGHNVGDLAEAWNALVDFMDSKYPD